MADGTLNFDTKIDESGFSAGASSIGSIVKGIGVEKIIESGLNAVKNLGKSVVETGMNFETSMSQVAATMGITSDQIAAGSEDFEKLNSAAKNMGATTQFSASQAADALNYLALAGYSVDKSIETLPTVLNLAAAGGMELGTASDMVTDAMSALGEKAGTAESFVDKMAKTAQKSNTGVEQLGNAILTVGGTAKSLSGGVTEMNTALGVLANRGIKGAEGGTALRNVILALGAPTDKAAEALNSLGVSAYDSEGKMRPLNEVFKDLDASMEGMSEGDKTNVLNNIFNKVDLKSAQALLAGCGEEWDNLADAIDNSEGAAADMAETMNDNLQGSLTMLSSALEGLQIELYEAFSEPLKEAVDVATECISQIVTGMQENGIPGAIAAAGDIANGFIDTIIANAPNVLQSGYELISSLIDGFVSNFPAVIASISTMLSNILSTIIDAMPNILQKGFELISRFAIGMLQNLPQVISSIGQIITTVLGKLMDNLPKMLEKGVQFITYLANGVLQNLPAIITAIANVIAQVINTIVSHLPDFLNKGIEIIGKLAAGLIQAIPKAVAAVPQIISGIINAFTSQNWGSVGTNIVNGIAGGVRSAVGAVVEAARGVASSAIQAAKNLLGIHSPSRVFAWMGEMCDRGLATGFISNIPKTTAQMSAGLKKAITNLETDASFTTSVHAQSGSVSGIVKYESDSSYNSGMKRLIALQEQANENAKALARRPIYLGTERIDRELPKGAVPAI